MELRAEWGRVEQERARHEAEWDRLRSAKSSEWFKSAMLPCSQRERVRLNVGGQVHFIFRTDISHALLT